MSDGFYAIVAAIEQLKYAMESACLDAPVAIVLKGQYQVDLLEHSVPLSLGRFPGGPGKTTIAGVEIRHE